MTGNSRTLVLWLTLVAVFALVNIAWWTSGAERMLAVRTLGMGLGASAIALPLAGLIVNVCRFRGLVCQLLLLTCVASLFVPLFVHVAAWDSALGKLGWLSTGGKSLEPILTGMSAAIWIHGIAAAPQVALIVWLGLSSGGRTYEEQALLDASFNSVFWNVTVRRLLPLFGLGFVWTMIICSREIAVTDIFQVGTLAEQIYLGYSLGRFNNLLGNWTAEQLAEAESASWLLTVVAMFWITVTVVLLCMVKFRQYTESEQRTESAFGKTRVGIWRSFLGGLLWLVIAGVPLANLLLRASFQVNNIDGEPVPGYSLSRLFQSLYLAITRYQVEFQWSLLIAVVSATVMLSVGALISWYAIERRLGRWLLALTIGLTAAMPAPLIGVTLARLFTSSGPGWIAYLYDRTIWPTVIAITLACWPLISAIIFFSLSSTAKDTLENARLEGAGGLTRLWRIAVGQNWAALIGCFLLAIAAAFGELSASQLVLPPGIDTIPRLTLGLLHAGVNEMTAALTILCGLAVTMVSWLGWQFLRS